jgi:CarD family transcriptional regulator
MYSVGDKVVHPGCGPGVIKSVERRQMQGEPKRYYVIEMFTGGGTLMTPVAQAGNVGLRRAIGPRSVSKLLRLLASSPSSLSSDFRERQTEIEERLRIGDVFTTAEVIRDLAWYDQSNGLTKRDSQLMQRAEDLVAGELALVKDIEVEEALDQIEAILTEAMSDAVPN